MGLKLVAFDMDGTLIKSYMDKPKKGWGSAYGDITILAGRRERLAELHADGVTLAIVTNQAGAAFGYQSPEETVGKIEEVIRMLGVPMRFKVCMAHEKSKIPGLAYGAGRRKPSPVMLCELLREMNIAPREAVFVGDMPTDAEAAELVENVLGEAMVYEHESAFFGTHPRI